MNRTLLGFIRKELTQTLRDPKMRSILFIAPVMQLTLFGVALSNEVKNVRLAAHFDPKDAVMRQIVDRAWGSGWFVAAEPSLSDPFEQIRSNQADAVLVAPPGGLTRALGQGPAPLQVLINANNVMRAQGIENYLQGILREVHEVREGIIDRDKAVISPLSIQFQVRVLYNPMLITSIFMVPGVMSMLMCVVTLLLTNMSISKEKERGTFEMLISAPVRSHEILLGKTLPFVLLGMSNFPLILGAGVVLFGVPVRGSLFWLTVSAFFFVCTTVAIGVVISSWAKNQQQSMLGGFLFIFPAILLSGLIFPLENMPVTIRYLAQLDPLSHFVALLRNIMLKGGDATFIALHISMLAAMAVIAAWMGFRRFRTTLD